MIISLVGFANSGKSTVAKYLVEKHGFTRMSFAGPVKDMAASAFGWQRSRLEGATPEDRAWRETPDAEWSAILGKPFSPRNALQALGEGMRQLITQDFWLQLMVTKIDRLPLGTNIVIDDTRYCNEWFALELRGATTLIIKRPEFPSEEHKRIWELGTKGEDIHTSLHPSESDWLRYGSFSGTRVIENDGDLFVLYKRIDDVYTSICAQQQISWRSSDQNYF